MTLLQLLAVLNFHDLSKNSMQAASPLTTYTAGVALYVLLVGFLVAILLIGGILVVNIGLMSKRDEDRIGGRTPSDVGILQHNVWPEERAIPHEMPSSEMEVEGVIEIRDANGFPSERIVEKKKIG
jgi:hypothetical protein